jgi:small acid-soluble spore protein F (minor alpha/beta-type SASP)
MKKDKNPFWRYYYVSHMKGVFIVSRRKRGMMSEGLKTEIAKELGFYDTVQREGWGGIRSKDAGNMVKRALEIAEQRYNNGNR